MQGDIVGEILLLVSWDCEGQGKDGAMASTSMGLTGESPSENSGWVTGRIGFPNLAPSVGAPRIEGGVNCGAAFQPAVAN